MSSAVIEVRDISKKFCAHMKKSLLYGFFDLLRGVLFMKPKLDLRPGEFWALKNIQFELQKGEVVGILGKNGSGKTTLLRLITGIFPATSGKIRVVGRLGSLVALGAGFHPHMTGRENIFLNGSILGMSRKEIESKLQQIIDFADIGDFLEAPVSTYSSGMTVRLGFSIAIHSEPEILIIDEVLAVGDVNFQSKCYEKIYELRKKGTSILLVSHSFSIIERLCQRCLVLHHGAQVFLGSTSDAIREYVKISSEELVEKKGSEPQQYRGAENAEIFDAKVYQADSSEQNGNIEFGKDFVIDFKYRFKNQDTSNMELRVALRTPEGRDVQLISFHSGHFGDHRNYSKDRYIQVHPNGQFQVRVNNQKFFPQVLRVDISFCRMDRSYHEGYKNNAASFRILQPEYSDAYFENGTMMVTQFDTKCTAVDEKSH